MEQNPIQVLEHVTRLPLFVLCTTGRTGSDFFQSLLDGHPEVLQLPGAWRFDIFWDKSLREDSFWMNPLSDEDRVDYLIDTLIWSDYMIPKFEGKYAATERYGELGPNQNETFSVSRETFRNHMRSLLAGRPTNASAFFRATHAAYAMASGVDVFKTKILFLNQHHIDGLGRLDQWFGQYSILVTVRDPRNTLVAGMEHWKTYIPGSFCAENFRYMQSRIFAEAEGAAPHSKDLRTLPLENMHLKTQSVLDDFCRWSGITFQPSMLQSTWHGKLWWGDRLSPKKHNGFNPNIRDRRWTGKLTAIDNFVIEYLLEPRLKKYGYEILSDRIPVAIRTVLVTFLIPLPMVYEFRLFVDGLTRPAPLKRKVRHILMAGPEYARRVALFYKQMIKRLRGKILLPKYLAQEPRIP